ncbi:hypothetical protein C5F48_02505 [Cereibacter changlensis JA139]|uniref:Transposase IS66 C-terminal domain-containing protein n=1 Tax=Cereibacter changlensis JA139 TaxID=1188249 RepID=A0A2T4JZL0_9RHOB|nr:hypothetical protein C5F48_02505 [Cereibacter changlensis JA139]
MYHVVCLTRKNALFAGSKRGGESWAILGSLVNTAKLNGIDRELWLADVLERTVSGATPINRLDTLPPWTWKAAREALRPTPLLPQPVSPSSTRHGAIQRRGHALAEPKKRGRGAGHKSERLIPSCTYPLTGGDKT